MFEGKRYKRIYLKNEGKCCDLTSIFIITISMSSDVLFKQQSDLVEEPSADSRTAEI